MLSEEKGHYVDDEMPFGGSAFGGLSPIDQRSNIMVETPMIFYKPNEHVRTTVNNMLEVAGIDEKVADILVFYEKGESNKRDQVLTVLKLVNRALMWDSDYPKIGTKVAGGFSEVSCINLVSGFTLKEQIDGEISFLEKTIVFAKPVGADISRYEKAKMMLIKKTNEILETFGADLIPLDS